MYTKILIPFPLFSYLLKNISTSNFDGSLSFFAVPCFTEILDFKIFDVKQAKGPRKGCSGFSEPDTAFDAVPIISIEDEKGIDIVYHINPPALLFVNIFDLQSGFGH